MIQSNVPRQIRRGTPPALAALLMAAGLLAAVQAPAASTIYRTVDENGNVVFTDVPPKPGEPGQAVDLDRGNSFTPPEGGERRDDRPTGRSLEEWLRGADGTDEEDSRASAADDYGTLRVESPANDQAVRANDGNVTVVAGVEPALQPGHTMQVYLDGALRQSGQTTTLQLVNVDRGTHTVMLRIVDGSGEPVAASEPSVFHLQRRSVLLQPGNRSGP